MANTSLRRRTLRAVGWLVAGMGVALLVPLGLLISRSFLQLEEQEAVRHLERAHNALSDQVAELGRIARDYGTWDDTVAFVRGQGSATYLATSYADDTFVQNGLDLVVITSLDRVLFARAFDPAQGRERPVPVEVARTPERFVGLGGGDGVLAFEEGLMLVGSSPVEPSSGGGPAQGQLVVGRWLSAAAVARLGRTTRLSLRVEPPSDEPVIERLDRDFLVAGDPLVGLDGRAVARLEVQLERSIWDQGRTTVGLLVAALFLIALGLLAALRLVLHRLVLQRIDALVRDVRLIRDHNDPDLRVAHQGGDELGLLAQSINEMLDSLRRLNRLLVVEQDKAEQLLLNVLPRPIAERLKQSRNTIADSFADASVLFADLTDFTRYSAHVSPVQLVGLLDDLFTRFDALAEQHGLEKIKTIGDAYLVVGGLPDESPSHVYGIAGMALDMKTALEAFNEQHQTRFRLRIGIHCGPVVAGVIGRRKFIYDIWGDTVNTASRLESHGQADEVQVSAAVAARIEDRFVLEPRGTIELKGKGLMATWWLRARRPVEGVAAAPPT